MYAIDEEKLSDVLEELKPLLSKHWKEVAWYQDRVFLSPDYDKYLKMEELGIIHLVTVRYKGKLVGYNLNIVSPHLHYSDDVFAVNDIIFLSPEHRGGKVSYALLQATEALLKGRGVNVVTLHMKVDNPFIGLVEKAGFKRKEYIYSKYIGD